MTEEDRRAFILTNYKTMPAREMHAHMRIGRHRFNEIWGDLHRIGLVPKNRPYLQSEKRLENSRNQQKNTDKTVKEFILKNWEVMTKRDIQTEMQIGKTRFQRIWAELAIEELVPEVKPEIHNKRSEVAKNQKHRTKLVIDDEELLALAADETMRRHELAEQLGISHSTLSRRLTEARKHLGVTSKFASSTRKKKPGNWALTMKWVDDKYINKLCKWRGIYAGCM